MSGKSVPGPMPKIPATRFEKIMAALKVKRAWKIKVRSF